MATVTKFANANTVITTGWSSATNAYADDAAYATAAPAKNTSITSDYGFAAFTTGDIPDGATINSVTFEFQFKSSTTSSTGAVIGIQGDNNGLLGTESTFGMSLSDVTQTKQYTSGVALADLRNANQVQARIRGFRANSNTAITWSVDYVKVTVDYTPNQAVAGTADGTSTTSGTVTGVGAIAGTADGTSTTTGAITSPGPVAGTTAGSSTVSGSVTGIGAVAGSAAGLAATDGTVVGLGAILGSADGGSTTAGAITGIGAIAGSSVGSANATGALNGIGHLSGTAAGASTVSGAVTGEGGGEPEPPPVEEDHFIPACTAQVRAILPGKNFVTMHADIASMLKSYGEAGPDQDDTGQHREMADLMRRIVSGELHNEVEIHSQMSALKRKYNL